MKKKILLVDDEPGIRRTLKYLLEDMGYDVTAAENGMIALGRMAAVRPHVVLTDIKMPGMDGIELLRKIKERSPDTEVVMMTGHGDMELAIRSLKFEATDFITKPILDDAVEVALDRAFEKIDIRRRLREYTENLEALVTEKSEKLIEMERLLAVGQAVEGVSSAMMDLAGDLNEGLMRESGGDLGYFNDLPCLVSLHSRDLKILATNPAFQVRAGAKTGDGSWEIYAGYEEERDRCPAARTFADEKGRRTREILKTRYMEIPVMVYSTPVRDRNGQVELVIEVAADMEEVKRLQDELRFARERYHMLFDEVPCYITVQNRELTVVEANRRFKEDFGDAIGEYCYIAYKHRESPCRDCIVARTFKDGKSRSRESVVTSKNGEQIHVLIWTAPIRDGRGNIVQVMEMSTNITRIYQLRDQLSSLGLLIGSISHGIKGLLTGLDGGVYMVDSGFAKKNPEKIREGWDIVKMTVGRIREMVLDILFYAKKRELDWERVDALSFIEETAAAFEPKIGKERIELVREFDPGLGDFEIDPGVVRSALINILENAIDACREDPEEKEHVIRFRAFGNDEEIIFEIRDNGMGMDAETRDSLFTLFFSSKGKKGTGLGLFVSKRVIEQHGGGIRVESEPGKGAAFFIRIPKRLPVSVKAEAAAASARTSGAAE